MRSLILGLIVVSNPVFANFNAGELMGSIAPIATTMLQNQQQAKQAEQQTDQARAQLVGQENAMAQQQAQIQQAETTNLMSQEKKGYPILDPFARQSYWALRDTQFKQSMAIAAQRSQLETKASKDAIDKEFQATQQMMTAVGGLMKTAGAQVQKIGEASEKKKVESQASAQATSDAEALRTNSGGLECKDRTNPTHCTRIVAENNGTCPANYEKRGNGSCYKVLSATELAGLKTSMQQGANSQTPVIKGCNRSGEYGYTCGGQSFSNATEARQAVANSDRFKGEITAKIGDLNAALVKRGVDDDLKSQIRAEIAVLEKAAEPEFLDRAPNFSTATSLVSEANSANAAYYRNNGSNRNAQDAAATPATTGGG